MLSDVINNGERFTQEINNMARSHNLSVMDSITLFCEQHNMDIHDIVPLLGSTMKELIRIEATDRRMLKQQPETTSLF